MKKFIGNTVQFNHLMNLVERDALQQAILFVGAGGVGKRTLTRMLAARLLDCDEEKLNSHSEFLVITKDADEAKLSIDPMRSVSKWQQRTSMNALRRVIIIEHIESVVTRSFNTLLKTIEEPQRNTYIMMTSEHIQNIPKTVLSRCAIVYLNFVHAHDMQMLIEGDYEQGMIEKMITWAGGRPGELMRILEQQKIRDGYLETSKNLYQIMTSSDDKRLQWVETVIPSDVQTARIRVNTLIDQIVVMLRAFLYSHGLKRKNLLPQLLMSFDMALKSKLYIHHNVQPKAAFDEFILSLPRFS